MEDKMNKIYEKCLDSLGTDHLIMNAWVAKPIGNFKVGDFVKFGVSRNCLHFKDRIKYFIFDISTHNTTEIPNASYVYKIPTDVLYKRFEFSNGIKEMTINSSDLEMMGGHRVVGGVKVRTTKDLISCDLNPNNVTIPKGTVLTIKEYLLNFYGEFITVEFEGRENYLKSVDLEYLGRIFEVADENLEDNMKNKGKEIIGTFNVSGKNEVDLIKEKASELVNLIEEYGKDPRRKEIAITNIEMGTMMAVKSIFE